MKKDQTIGNRQTGETLTMLISEEENGGALQFYRVHLPPHRPSPPLHYHIAFTETFTAVEGTLDIYLGRKRRHVPLGPGESITADIGQPHTFANDSEEPCTATVETRPAGGVVKAFQLAYGIANDGGAAGDGLPKNPLVRLRFIQISQGFLPVFPLGLQRAVFATAAGLARITGIERHLRGLNEARSHSRIGAAGRQEERTYRNPGLRNHGAHSSNRVFTRGYETMLGNGGEKLRKTSTPALPSIRGMGSVIPNQKARPSFAPNLARLGWGPGGSKCKSSTTHCVLRSGMTSYRARLRMRLASSRSAIPSRAVAGERLSCGWRRS
jgi:mannose-6-phosphate isomerase-like protein (cupin superfamily)